jgi:anti-sigma B factor antagonist
MQITKSDLASDVVALVLDGRLNMVAAPRLRTAIDESLHAGKPRIVVDLTGVTFIDSSGLGALIAGLRKAREASGDVRIAGVGPQVATVLKLTNLDRVLRAYASVDEARSGW